MKRVPWSLEEACILYDFYIKHKENTVSKQQLQALSELYQKRADILRFEKDAKFRNISGLSLQLACLDDIVSSSGNRHSSKLFRDVHQLYQENPQIFSYIVDEFYQKYG